MTVFGVLVLAILASGIVGIYQEPAKWFRQTLYTAVFVLNGALQILLFNQRRGYAITDKGMVAWQTGTRSFVRWDEVRRMFVSRDSITTNPKLGWWNNGFWNRCSLVLPRDPELRARIVAEVKARRQEVIHRRVADLA